MRVEVGTSGQALVCSQAGRRATMSAAADGVEYYQQQQQLLMGADPAAGAVPSSHLGEQHLVPVY